MIHLAEYGLIFSLLAFLAVHLMVLFRVLPYSIVWGGRIKSDGEMLQKQSFAVAMTLFFTWVSLEKIASLSGLFSEQVLTVILWLMVAFFALGTFGNLFSKSKVEKYLFTTLSLVLVVSSLVLLLQ